MIISSRVKLFFAIILILCTSFALYYSSLNYFFFQDDFFEINISRASNLSEYLNFFKFRNDIIAYRPVSLQNYFFISRSLFGLNPTGFRILTLLLFFLSFFLITRVIQKITHDKKIGLLTGSLWITSSVHFMALTWIAAAYNIIGTFFWLLASLLFLKYKETGAKKYYLLTISVFLITIGSYEFSVTWPIIFIFYYFFIKKNTFSTSFITFSPFLILTLIYIILRLFLIRVPDISEYKISLNLESVKLFFWYALWTFNIPEEFKKQVVNNLIIFNNKFLFDFWQLTAKAFIGAVWVIALGVVLPLVYIFKQKLNLNIRLIIFSIFWFVVGISPVLVLPNHTFTMYLTLASIGIYFMMAYLLISSKKIILAVPVLLIWLYTSYTTLSFYKVNSWMIKAQKTANDAKANLKQSFPTLSSNSVVYYPVNSHWEKQALSGHDFVRTIYDDQSLLIYYNKYDLIKDFKEGLTLPIYLYVPK